MYCVKCGVKLADTEEACPLCHTGVGEVPERKPVTPLYPADRVPERKVNKSAVNGTILFLWALPVLVCLFVDLQVDWSFGWSWYVAGAMAVSYVMFALPMWFSRPNPVIFVPCSFASVAAYLWLVALLTGGDWYFGFALPVTGGFAVIVTAVVTLLRYVKKGRLYILGGAFMALGAMMLAVELLMLGAFSLPFAGWSVYPLIVLFLLGGMLIFLGINKTARERMERRFFF